MPFPSGRLDIPLDWSAEQATAVLEFLQSLQDQLWMLYHHDIHNHQRQQQQSEADFDPLPRDDSQPPF
jgi:hypothetical protein